MKVTRRKHLHQLGAALLAPCGIAALSPFVAAQANPPAWRQGYLFSGSNIPHFLASIMRAQVLRLEAGCARARWAATTISTW